MHYPEFLITTTADQNNPNNVTIAFAMGTKALEKGHDVGVLLLSYGVHLAQKGYVDPIDIGEPFPAVKDAFKAFQEKGGKLLICKACMVHNNVLEEELVEGATIVQAEDVIDIITNAKHTLQLNG
ncbi:DsrE family protein [Rubeoparvulum massiliense]|uniref:DsrE family protein n=1 Tax=Rubeoparvulum massiliense TaxID=1631346 RepID=UPI00065DD339|nr:DsrE family protein [Rubeoparvulum massiliense]